MTKCHKQMLLPSAKVQLLSPALDIHLQTSSWKHDGPSSWLWSPPSSILPVAGSACPASSQAPQIEGKHRLFSCRTAMSDPRGHEGRSYFKSELCRSIRREPELLMKKGARFSPRRLYKIDVLPEDGVWILGHLKIYLIDIPPHSLSLSSCSFQK